MSKSQTTDAFWQAYLKTLADDHPHRSATYTAWAFGDSPTMANELGALVTAGVKTATASAIWEYEADDEPLPEVGELSLILDGDEKPLCIIETTEVRILPFNEVDADFAYDEGEDDRTLLSWRRAHETFFKRTLPRIGREFDETMPILCERFRVIYPPTA